MSDLSDKAVAQFKLKVGGLLGTTFSEYGQGVHVTPVVNAILEFAIDMHALLLADVTPGIVEAVQVGMKRDILLEFDRMMAEKQANDKAIDKENEEKPD